MLGVWRPSYGGETWQKVVLFDRRSPLRIDEREHLDDILREGGTQQRLRVGRPSYLLDHLAAGEDVNNFEVLIAHDELVFGGRREMLAVRGPTAVQGRCVHKALREFQVHLLKSLNVYV
jgi:hypothetical protein